MAQWVKNPLAVQELQDMQVQSLGREHPLAVNRGAWQAPVHGVTELDTTEATENA